MKSDTNWINLETQYLAIKIVYTERKYVFLFVEINGGKSLRVLNQHHRRVNVTPASYSEGLRYRSLGWLTIFVNCHDASGKLMSYRILRPATEGPATGHLDTGFSWFPCSHKQMLRWFPRFQVATTCFSCSPPDLNLLVTNLMFCIHVK